MTTRYVGPGGSDANSGLSWALRKLTLNGVEDIPVVANDTVYVGPGVYRELLTCDVSGGAGTPITYIGDVTGEHTDGVGGVMRITGSDDDQTTTRTGNITVGARAYRTFRGFYLDMPSNVYSNSWGASTNVIFEECVFAFAGGTCLYFDSDSIANYIIRRCIFLPSSGYQHIITFTSTSGVANGNHLIENVIFLCPQTSGCIRSVNVGGITVKNVSVIGGNNGIKVTTLPGGYTAITVNNSYIVNTETALRAVVLGYIVENYNSLWGNGTDRTNVAIGANSVTYPPLFDARWFFELVGSGRMVSPFDLASYSQLVNLAGTSPPTTDMRGTAVIGAEREWGPLEYDPTLLYRRVIARQV